MGSLFSKKEKKPPSRISEQDKAVLQLKQQRDKLHQYQERVNQSLSKDREVAKQLLKDGRKDKAKLLLRKKKYQESLLSKTDTQLENIETLVHDIEFAQIESQVISGLKVGNEALKKMHELLSLEDVEKIMDETRESVEYQQEIDALLAGGLTNDDEQAVLDELEAIVQEGETQITEADLPSVPKDAIADEERTREKVKDKQKPQAVLAS